MIRLFVTIGVLLLAGLAIACGDDDDDANGNGAATATAAESDGDGDVSGSDGPPPVAGEPIETDSGLQIIEVTVGDGDEVAPGDIVTVHYTGWLDDGTVFDSSVERGTPATFALSDVIQGWQEGIPGMQVGGTRRLIIPPELAYGSQARGNIPPNSRLTFDVELISIG